MQAEGLRAGWQAFSLRGDSRREPKALPWAEGSQAFGLKTHRCRTRNYGIRNHTSVRRPFFPFPGRSFFTRVVAAVCSPTAAGLNMAKSLFCQRRFTKIRW